MNKRYHKLRSEYVEILGGKCVDCGALDNLEFDHVDPTTKTYDVGKILTHKRSKVLAELEKCVLRCSLCHVKKSTREQSVEHGQGLTGKRNCGCPLCAPLKAAYMRKRRGSIV